MIERLYEDGEVVNVETLRSKKFFKGMTHGIKILGRGELTKKVTIEAQAISAGAKEKLDVAKITYRTV
jgi:large subunit ribosomal protein L15